MAMPLRNFFCSAVVTSAKSSLQELLFVSVQSVLTWASSHPENKPFLTCCDCFAVFCVDKIIPIWTELRAIV